MHPAPSSYRASQALNKARRRTPGTKDGATLLARLRAPWRACNEVAGAQRLLPGFCVVGAGQPSPLHSPPQQAPDAKVCEPALVPVAVQAALVPVAGAGHLEAWLRPPRPLVRGARLLQIGGAERA